MRINWLRYLVTIWDLARARDKAALERFVRWKGKTIIFDGLPKERPDFTTIFDTAFNVEPSNGATCADVEADILVVWNEHLEAILERGNPIQPAMLLCQAALNFDLQDRVNVCLVWDPRSGRPGPQIVAGDLWGAILLQFANAIAGDRQYQRCPGCGRWFELTPEQNRADKQTCSGSCRTSIHRRRQRLAVQLHADGKSPREIAKELGSKVEHVKRWIKRHQNRKEK
jgi:hypothetical protein